MENAPVNVSATLVKNRLKILYIQLNTPAFAGIERVLDTICTHLAEKYADNFEIDVLYTSFHKDRPPEPRKYRTIDRLARSRFGLLRAYREVVGAKPYSLVVVPQIEPTVICMTACLGMKRSFALYLHGNPLREGHHFKARVLFYLMKTIYLSRLSCVFGISIRQIEAFNKLFNSKSAYRLLPNPVRRFDNARTDISPDSRYVTFVNVGRFDTQKGQDILIDAFSRALKIRTDIRLKLVGYGMTEPQLRQQIADLDIEPYVTIEHHPDDPSPALSASDVYVSTSRWEGFGLAICEALRFGLPVVATDCDFGPSEILINERLGRLVPPGDLEGLARQMIYYRDNASAERLHSEYRREYVDQYSAEHVVDIHADALLEAIETGLLSRLGLKPRQTPMPA